MAPREASKPQEIIAMRFLNASVLPRKSLNHLFWSFPLGTRLPKTRVLERRVLERKRKPNANASVDPIPKISALLRKRPVLLRANFVLTRDRKRPYYGDFCGKIHREGSCSKAAGGP